MSVRQPGSPPSPSDALEVGRRRLLSWLLGTSFGALVAAILYPVARFLNPPEERAAATNEADAGAASDPEFLEKGYKIVRFGSEPVIVVRVSETEFRAFSAVCTHLACTVTYEPENSRIHCACHGGVYDPQSGANVSGPPPKPLAK